MQVKYAGCFFDPIQLEKKLEAVNRKPLSRTIDLPHVTFLYRPQSIPENMIGSVVTLQVDGYGNDGENEALSVSFLQTPDGLKQLARNIAVPHITLSVAAHGKPVNSARLHFTPIEPFSLTGIFGFVDFNGKKHT